MPTSAGLVVGKLLACAAAEKTATAMHIKIQTRFLALLMPSPYVEVKVYH